MMNGKEKIVLVGGGGHCTSVIDVIEAEGKYEIAGIVDKEELLGQSILGYKIIAGDKDLEKLVADYKNFIITVGHIKSNTARVRLFNMVKKMGGVFPVIQSPRSYVSKHAFVNEGTVIMHNALVSVNVKIGSNAIINTGAVIEHEAMVGHHCHISTGAYVNGECQIGDHTFIGSQAVLRQCLHIGSNALIGAGAVVVQNVESNGVYAGNPATLKHYRHE